MEASCFKARRAESGDGVSWGSGSAASSPSGVWGGAPAEIEFAAFQS